ncbi:MAG: NUDIX hydrolase [Methanomicrobium sp.]|nr:NUDIX hydrolase [Methanomicrobium sp.]MDD4300143.1 NUDIX hydrolase [Methanomicrobium sp.]
MKKIDDIYSGGRMKVERVEVDLPGGITLERIVVKPGGAVAILPMDDENCYLIKQYRYSIDEYICEAPAGTIDEDEKPEETAHRELIEETGLRCEELISKGYIYTTPGFTNERIFLYEAHSLSPSDEFQKDDDEVIEVVKVKKEEVFEMIEDGRIVDAKTICLVFKCLGMKKE